MSDEQLPTYVTLTSDEQLPRYVVGLQKFNDPRYFKYFFECKSFSKAKEMANKKAADTGMGVIVFDRHEFSLVYEIKLIYKKE